VPALTNKRQEAYCQAIANGRDRIDAYEAAYGTQKDRKQAARGAYRLAQQKPVRARIEELTSRKNVRTAIAEVIEAKRTGRPSLWRPEFTSHARELALLGLSDEGIARAINAPLSVFNKWLATKPSLRIALNDGRELANGRVASALFKRATGYETKAEKVFQYQGQVVRAETLEHHPPDTQAASFWLRNRAPDHWKERREVDVAGTFEHRFSLMTPQERAADAQALADQVRRRLMLDQPEVIEGEAIEVPEDDAG
jgi:hypothetical protein